MESEYTQATAVSPSTQVSAELNAVPSGWELVYTPDGRRVMVEAADRAALEVELGLLPVQYDFPAAVAEWRAQYHALGDAVEKSLAELAAVGYQRDETVWVMNEAHGQYVSAYQHLARAIGALVPTEANVRDTAAHKALHGHLGRPGQPDAPIAALARLESLADTYQPRAA